MTFLPYIAAYILGCLSTGTLVLWLLLRIHRTLPPTLHDQGKWRDAPVEVATTELPTEPMFLYGVTGEER